MRIDRALATILTALLAACAAGERSEEPIGRAGKIPVVAGVDRSVVRIGFRLPDNSSGWGTGFFVHRVHDAEKRVFTVLMTAAHVSANHAASAETALWRGLERITATFFWLFENARYDYGVFLVEGHWEGCVPAASRPALGAPVAVVGYLAGEHLRVFPGTVTAFDSEDAAMYYTRRQGLSKAGISGGPVFLSDGTVGGIHLGWRGLGPTVYSIAADMVAIWPLVEEELRVRGYVQYDGR